MIRTATSDDLPLVRALWQEFEAEVPDAPWRENDEHEDLADLVRAIDEGVVLLDDDDALAVCTMRGSRLGFVDILYVRPSARGRGVARGLMQEAAARLAERGAEQIELEVLASNASARALYEHWGFAPVELVLAIPAARLMRPAASGPTFGSIHVQTDDANAVGRSAQKAVPRFGRSQGTDVTGPVNGWVTVRDALANHDPKVLRALAKELSYASAGVVLALGVEDGALVHYTLYDRGSVVDEYASVPEYHGALPPGDVIALGANPTVVARLTGAAPTRVREIARTASSPSDLPPWNELYEQIAELMGVDAHADVD